MDEIIEHVAAMCQADPLQTARYLVGLMLWSILNTTIIFGLMLENSKRGSEIREVRARERG